MFKIMTCPETGIHLVYKKFFCFWIKWCSYKSNMATNTQNALHLMNKGSYCFNSPRNTFFWINDSDAIVNYYNSVEDFVHSHAEDLI